MKNPDKIIALDPFGTQIHKQYMGVSPVGNRGQPAFVKLVSQSLRVADNLIDIGFEFRLLRLSESHGLCRRGFKSPAA